MTPDCASRTSGFAAGKQRIRIQRERGKPLRQNVRLERIRVSIKKII